jgi:hypothetical protein
MINQQTNSLKMSIPGANEAFKETEECQVGPRKFKISHKAYQTLSQPG